jgi:hypothetical protein
MTDNQHPNQNHMEEESLAVANSNNVIIEQESEASLIKNQNQEELLRYAEKHPLFLHKEDEFLGRLIELLTPILLNSPTTSLENELIHFKEKIYHSIFGKKKVAELKKEFKKLGLNNKTACGELISASTICFRCLDCDMPYNNSGQTPIICIKCFDKSNHDGHRLVVL